MPTPRSKQVETTILRVRVDSEEDYVAAAESADATQGATLEAVTQPGEVEEALAPIVAVLIGVGVLAAGKFTLDWMDRVRGGVVIDRRPTARDLIYRDRDLPYGWVVVLPPDTGKVEIEVKDAPRDMVERLVSDVIGGSLDTATTVVDAAKAVVGAEKISASRS
jgi:hypothetical protein